jgi:hypothetical protein
MRILTALVLIVLGSLLILGPLVISANSRAANKENVAEYYRRNSYGVGLPEAMEPAGTGPYAWACWASGTLMVVCGMFSLSRAASFAGRGSVPPAPIP